MTDSSQDPVADTMHLLVREKNRFCVIPFPTFQDASEPILLPEAKEVEYAPNGAYFAAIEGQDHGIAIRDGATGNLIRSFGGLNDQKTPLKVSFVTFSPMSTYLLAWARPMQGVDVPNLVVYRVSTGESLGSFYHKTFHKDFWPFVQWSEDESIAVKTVTNTLHFFRGDDFSKPTSKLGIPGVEKCALSRGSAPYTLAVFIAGKTGGPGKFAMYTHPDQGGEQLMHRSAFRADSVDFMWNSHGSAVLALVSTNVDSSGKSYYGQSEVYFMNKRGTVCERIDLKREGPTYDAAWSPSGDHFILIYGYSPAMATLFSVDNTNRPPYKMDFTFGTGSWNTIVFSPHGRYVALAGFGSLSGQVEFWDYMKQSVIGRVELPCTTEYSWSPCSRYFMGATTYPRLREANGYRIARIDGKIIHQVDLNDTHVYQARLRPGNPKALPDPMTTTGQMIGGPLQKPASKNKGGVYRPPGSRGAAASFSLHDDVKAGKVNKDTFSTANGVSSRRQRPTPSGKKVVPGMDPNEAEQKPSKSALKRKKKKEKERLAQLQKEKDGDTSTNGSVSELPQFESLAAAEKKLKTLRKKMRQITALKESEQEGKELKEEQKAKLNTESKLLVELGAVEKVIEQMKVEA